MSSKAAFLRGLYLTMLLSTAIYGITLNPLRFYGYGYLSDTPHSMALSPDGNAIAIACRTGIVISEFRNGGGHSEILLKLPDNELEKSKGISVVDFVDIDFVVGGTFDGKIWLWDRKRPNKPSLIDSLVAPDNLILLSAVDPNTLIAVYSRGMVRVLAGVTPYEIKKNFSINLSPSDTDIIVTTDYNHATKQLAIVMSSQNKVYFYRYEKGKLLPIGNVDINSPGHYITALKYSIDGNYLAYAYQNTVKILKTDLRHNVVKTVPLNRRINSLCFSDDGRILFVASGINPQLTIIPMKGSPPSGGYDSFPISALRTKVNNMLYLPERHGSGIIAIASLYPEVIGISPESGNVLWRIGEFINGDYEFTPPPIVYSADGDIVLASEFDFTRFSPDGGSWHIPTDEFESRFVSLASPDTDGEVVALNADGIILAIDRTTILWTKKFSGNGFYFKTHAIDIAAKTVFVGADSGLIYMSHVDTSETSVFSLPGKGMVTALRAISVGGHMGGFAGTSSGMLYYFDPAAGTAIKISRQPYGKKVTSVEYSPENQIVIAGFSDGTVVFYGKPGYTWNRLSTMNFSGKIVKIKMLLGNMALLAYSAGISIVSLNGWGVQVVYKLKKPGILSAAVSPDLSTIAVFMKWGQVQEYAISYEGKKLEVAQHRQVSLPDIQAQQATPSAPEPPTYHASAGAFETQATPSKPAYETSSIPATSVPSPETTPVRPNPSPDIAQAPPPPPSPPSFQPESTPSAAYFPSASDPITLSSMSGETQDGIMRLNFHPGGIVQLFGQVKSSSPPSQLLCSVRPIIGQNFSYQSSVQVAQNGRFTLNLQFPTGGIYELKLWDSGGRVSSEYILLVGDVKNVYLIVYALNAPRAPEFPSFNELEVSGRQFFNDMVYGLNISDENAVYMSGTNASPRLFLDKLREFKDMAGDTGVIIIGIFAPALIDYDNPKIFYIPGIKTRPDNITTNSISSYALKNILGASRGQKLLFMDVVKRSMLQWQFEMRGANTAYSGLDDMVSSLNQAVLGLFKNNRYACVISSSQMQTESYTLQGERVTLFARVIDEGLKGKADTDSDGIVTLREIKQYLRARMPEIAPSSMPGFSGNCNINVPLSVVKLIE